MCIYCRDRRAYPSDVTDEEWAILGPLIPVTKPGGRPQEIERREIVNGILYVLRSGCPWRMLPHDLPNWSTVYLYFRQWKQTGVWEQVNAVLRREVRVEVGREPEPSAAIVDSQSIKTSSVRGDARGDAGGKKIQGRKRHLLVDTLGLLLSVKVLAAVSVIEKEPKIGSHPLVGNLPRLRLIWGESGESWQAFPTVGQRTPGRPCRNRQASVDWHARSLGERLSCDRLGQDHAQRLPCPSQTMGDRTHWLPGLPITADSHAILRALIPAARLLSPSPCPG